MSRQILPDGYQHMLQSLYKPVAWGYATRNAGDGEELLVAERVKRDDPHRGQLVLPGGGREKGDQSFTDTALREVFEETGVRARVRDRKKFWDLTEYPVLARRDGIDAIIDANGMIYVVYTDSGKAYKGVMVDMEPLGEPVERNEEDAARPQFMARNLARERVGDFTPACRLLLEIADAAETSQEFPKRDDVEIHNTNGLYQALRGMQH
jgi:8-oxo-dGTP pyrophosphatase MutT (NUDIX family)